MAILAKDAPLSSLRIGFIGAGRLGRALAWSFEAHGCTVHAAASRSAQGALSLAKGTRNCLVLPAQGVADECDLIFIVTPDASIEPMARSVEWRPEVGVVHCSGATEISALAKAADDGASIGGFHPMQTFGDPEAAARTLPGCTITIEAQNELNRVLTLLAENLGCRVNQLPPGARAGYHAAAAYASQYVNVLLGEAVRIWQSWGVGEEDALHALLPMVRGTVASIEAVGLAKGMPGPVSRGDAGTVAQHLSALAEFDPATASLYRDLCLRSVPLAEKAGGIDAETARKIRRVLSEGPLAPGSIKE